MRKDVKAHGLQRGIEGPLLDPETDRCLIVEDVVTTGSATLAAIDRVKEAGLQIVGVVSVLTAWPAGPRRSSRPQERLTRPCRPSMTCTPTAPTAEAVGRSARLRATMAM